MHMFGSSLCKQDIVDARRDRSLIWACTMQHVTFEQEALAPLVS